MVAYVYSLRFQLTGQWYIGCRYTKSLTRQAVEHDLLVRYFTSSKIIKNLIKIHGVKVFEPKIRKIFDNADEAKAYEVLLLKRVNARDNPDFLNQCNSVFESAPDLVWITNGLVDTMIARGKPLLPGFNYGRSQNNRNRNYEQSLLRGRIHVFDSDLNSHRMIPSSEYNPSRHIKMHNDYNKGRKWIHNPDTGECRLVYEGYIVPNTWQYGNPYRGSMSWFYNPVTGEQRQIPRGSDPPIGFIKGRPATHIWLTHTKTGHNIRCKVDESIPVGYIRGRTISKKK